jgi:hypothetical protein
MVTLSPEAVAKIEQTVVAANSTHWVLTLSWRKGAADNRRTVDGSVAWNRDPDLGWGVTLRGWPSSEYPQEIGTPLLQNVRLVIYNFDEAPGPFPGGEVYVEKDKLNVRPHAI